MRTIAKRATALFMVLAAISLGLSACGTNGATSDNADNSQDTSTPAVTETVDTSSQTQKVEKTTPDTAETTPISQEETQQETQPTAQPQEDTPQETTVSEEVSPKFTEVNETVYATTSVNVRSSYSADSNKVGSLSAGASATRTGVGDNGWSRIVYGDSVAYVSSDYLNTTKPTIAKPSTSTPSTSTPSTSTPSTSTPSSGGDTLTEEEQENHDKFVENVEDMGGWYDPSTGITWVP